MEVALGPSEMMAAKGLRNQEGHLPTPMPPVPGSHPDTFCLCELDPSRCCISELGNKRVPWNSLGLILSLRKSASLDDLENGPICCFEG